MVLAADMDILIWMFAHFGVVAVVGIIAGVVSKVYDTKLEASKLLAKGTGSLSEADIDRIADRVAAKLSSQPEPNYRKLLLELARMTEEELVVYREHLKADAAAGAPRPAVKASPVQTKTEIA
ncbi:hypothetical protein HY251_02895 [bacterium]|nr:hypothetical protein [bacterium]